MNTRVFIFITTNISGKSETSIFVVVDDSKRKGQRLTAHNNFHDKAVSETGFRSSKEGYQGVTPSGTAIHLEPETFQRGALARQEAAAKIAREQSRKRARLQSSLKIDTASEMQRRHAERLDRALASAMTPLRMPADYIAALQSARTAMAQIAEAIKTASEKIDLSGIVNAFKPIALKINRLSILTKSQWPMYLVDNSIACDQIDSLPDDAADEELRSYVGQIAFECLDEQWLDETKTIWESHEEITEGEMRLLVSALERHRKQDYEGCVSLLMNIFEGLIEKYAPNDKALDKEQEETFDYYADQHNLDALYSKGKRRKLGNIKDKVLLMLITSENGWLTFDNAINYLVDITLINRMDNALAEHNPLRNQICHGKQTEFDTLEHSLKAILVTDLIIRYGGALREGQSIEARINEC